ncbi:MULTISPECIES: L-aspartate oxidase [Coprobacillaceae]|uniref:L-aspartate oxidase n=1 Tax=Coprobacillaceae TaxID=2810280 RepID=UPI000E4A8EC2|nr:MULTISPECIES: L-aspartate oxidase [Coprobacillaceae]RHM61161.1 L-aspartate oxidase [Coprobacillus sp. AF33-1AC]RHS91956.1 L-aspartate oxidase [Erysipelatoclostridium sp. AM42-17]
MNTYYDVIIVGTGAAGLFAALSLDPQLNILMITKDKVENSDSYLAQGGICTLKSPDDFDAFYNDTLKAGHGENNPESVKIMIKNSPHIMKELMDYGVEFDLDKQGNLAYTREGAHSNYRILHHQDVTGKEITSKLIMQVKKRSHITLLEDTTMLDLVCDQNQVKGIIVLHEGEIKQINSKAVILATGGMGGLFKHSTNFRHITGDSFAIALKNHVELENINYIQIHPTTLYTNKNERSFLISESVRGEGAYLLNKDGERFTDELQPRDVVSNAIREQMKKDHSDHVYLSVMHMDHDQVLNRFPHIYDRCKEEGYDMFKQPVPVVPAQHYLMGGIKADTCGKTSMTQLYAVGETACNGVHGANRLASNSLLESLVFAKRAAGVINETIAEVENKHLDYDLTKYQDVEKLQKENHKLVLDEIKKRDEEFYDKWCQFES